MGKTIHQGQDVRRFRGMPGIKQEGLALEPGEDRNQRKISLLEQKVETPGLLTTIPWCTLTLASPIFNDPSSAAQMDPREVLSFIWVCESYQYETEIF